MYITNQLIRHFWVSNNKHPYLSIKAPLHTIGEYKQMHTCNKQHSVASKPSKKCADKDITVLSSLKQGALHGVRSRVLCLSMQ